MRSLGAVHVGVLAAAQNARDVPIEEVMGGEADVRVVPHGAVGFIEDVSRAVHVDVLKRVLGFVDDADEMNHGEAAVGRSF